jgi:glycosyltransferase involved in cell wall biosynthesis
MTILYFYQYFSTPKGSWGTRVYEFGKEWVEQGHRVIVVTSVYSKSDIKSTRFIDTQYFDGIEVKIINIRIDNKLSFIKRIYGFITYSLVASYFALTIKCDRVIASSGPITVALPGLIAKIVRRRKLIFEVRDLWPQGAIELGLLNNSIVKKIAYWIERTTYAKSDLIVVLSPGMIYNINERYNFGFKCISIPNTVDLSLFSNIVKSNFTKRNYSYAIYTGNIGDVNNSFWLLNAARELKSRGITNIKILMIGDGQLKNEIKFSIENEKIDTLILLDLMPKNEIIPLLQEALVSLVPLKGTPILDTSSPNKFFESLGAGIFIIQNTNGWMREFLKENGVGATINPNDHKALVNEIIRLNSLSIEDKLAIKKKCMEVARQFDKKVLSAKMINSISKL